MKITTVDDAIEEFRNGRNIWSKASIELFVREIERLQGKNEHLIGILQDFYNACFLDDADGNLTERVTGDMMFYAHQALDKER